MIKRLMEINIYRKKGCSMKIKILIFGLIILIFTNLGCVEKESSNFVNINEKSDKEEQPFKEEKDIIFEKLIFKDEHLSGEISKNKFKKQLLLIWPGI